MGKEVTPTLRLSCRVTIQLHPFRVAGGGNDVSPLVTLPTCPLASASPKRSNLEIRTGLGQRELGDGEAGERLIETLRDFAPERRDLGSGGALQRNLGGDEFRFHDREHLLQRDILGFFRQTVATGLTALRDDESAFAEFVEQLHQVIGRDVFEPGEFFDARDGRAAVAAGELGEDAEGILEFEGGFHALCLGPGTGGFGSEPTRMKVRSATSSGRMGAFGRAK